MKLILALMVGLAFILTACQVAPTVPEGADKVDGSGGLLYVFHDAQHRNLCYIPSNGNGISCVTDK